ncbi:hypothetical protein AMATHDRAFT_60266 [Amanita thiersii Skay4041]|uniref:Uncharacterized protein n=1 Tax=Amanita thiersii Skay4041 TaxID=703135 RepID=A0A2A9NNC8_9AGAR|nr:hypothetical protein AMATHDRAFT_60266 [Amanita thiersii Skay4041]
MDSRPPPPQGPPPPYAFVTKVYRGSLRPIVVFTTSLGSIWALIMATGYLRNYNVDRVDDIRQLATLCLAQGIMYMGVFAIELYGLISAILNKQRLVRVYAYASIISVLTVMAGNLWDIVIHFKLKNEIIKLCSELLDDHEVIYFGLFGPQVYYTISQDDANRYCRQAWNHDSWSDIVYFIIISLVSIMFTVVAFSYLHQLMDPTSAANAGRAPSSQARINGYPSYYNPPYNMPYNGPYDGQHHGYQTGYPQYAPPPGPPPNVTRDEPFTPPKDSDWDKDGRPPSYVGDGLGYGAGLKNDDKNDPFSERHDRM